MTTEKFWKYIGMDTTQICVSDRIIVTVGNSAYLQAGDIVTISHETGEWLRGTYRVISLDGTNLILYKASIWFKIYDKIRLLYSSIRSWALR